MARVLVLSHDDVRAALPVAECVEVMAEVLAARARDEAYMPLRSVMRAPGAPGLLGLMPAWRGAPVAAFALKAVCVIPGNPARGLDAHQGTVTLFDGETGIPTAILDGSAVTAIRTAAVTAVATRTLAREDAHVLAIIGAGVQGRSHVEALAPTRTFDEVRVFAPTKAHAQALVEFGTECLGSGVRVIAAAGAREACEGADVIVTATNAREPVIARDWLGAGAHVNAIGASTPNASEIDTATVAASALFCDSRESVRNEAREFRLAVDEGLIAGEEHIRAELGEVLAGLAPGRADASELTLFRSLGIAVEDLAAAQHAVAAARGLQLGAEVEL